MKKFVSLCIVLSAFFLFAPSAFAYIDGFSSDWNSGYSYGYETGHTDGYKEGFQDGYNQGKEMGANKGEKESRALKEELQGANSQLRIYKNSTVGLGFLSAALVLGAAGYYFFFIKKKKLLFLKPKGETTDAPTGTTRPISPEPSSSNSARSARIVRVRAVKKAPAPAASLTRPSISAAMPDPEQTPPAPIPAENRSPAKPKEGKPDPSEEVHNRAKDLGLGMKWFDFLRGHFWGPALVFFVVNRLATSSISRTLVPLAVGGNLIASVIPLTLMVIEVILYVNFFNSLVSCSFNAPSKWAYFCTYSMIIAIIGLLFSLASFFYIDFIYYFLFLSWFIPNIIYLGKRKKLF